MKQQHQDETGLVRYDAMCRAIDAALEVDEVKDIRDKAMAMQVYARQALNTEAERRAAEIRMRAERKMGQLLDDELKDGRPEKVSPRSTLSDLGITRDQSSQWQRLGRMTDEEFEGALGRNDKPPTTKGLLRSNENGEDEEQPPQRLHVRGENLWVWGTLYDFETLGYLDQDPNGFLENMTEEMRDDVYRLAPKVVGWLKQIKEETSWAASKANSPASSRASSKSAAAK
jgi:hypothetical protein